MEEHMNELIPEWRKKDSQRKRNHKVVLRLSDDEKVVFLEQCRKAKMTQQDYLLSCAMEKEINVIGGADELNQLIYEFNKQGTNLNQIAKKLNSEDFVSVNSYQKIHEDYENLLDAMLRILDKVR